MRKSLIIGIIMILTVTYASIFIVPQVNRGIVLRFGKVLRNSENKPIIYNPGLHFKVPFLETSKMLDSRVQTLEIHGDRYLTSENKDLIIDSYLKWHVTNFNRYYMATGGGNLYQAETLLKRKFSDRLRSEFARLTVKNIITDSRGHLTIKVRNLLNKGTKIDKKTKEATTSITSAAHIKQKTNLKPLIMNANSMAILGIEIVDFRIKRIELPNEVSTAIYARMRAEREAVARQLRSQGEEEATKIRAITDKTVTETLAKAERTKLIYRGEGDAIATKLFANAFNQDPEFYTFVRSLSAYEKSFKNGNDIIVISPDTDFFRFMKAPIKPSKIK